MAHGHPIAAGIFITGIVCLIGYSSVNAIQHQRIEREEKAKKLVETKRSNIAEAVRRGEEGDYESAAVMLAEVYNADPGDIDAAYNLGIALQALGKNDDAEKIFSGILAKDPEDYDATAELAGVYDAKGDADRALQLLDKVPVGKANMTARLEDGTRWAAVRKDARFEALLTKHGAKAATPPAPEGEAPAPE